MSTSSSEPATHQPVLLAQTLQALALRPDGVYVDATFGRGGHSGAILERLGASGRLLAIDQDPEAARAAAAPRFADDPRFEFHHLNFGRIGEALAAARLTGRVDGLLFDLGVSSPQLDDPRRGFSFRFDGPLDMRMNPDAGVSAAQWLAEVDEAALVRVLKEFGEERFARRVARAVVAARADAAITRTRRLVELIDAAIPRAGRDHGKHPATRSFQAIRIAVNDEFGELKRALDLAPDALAAGGRLAVISFHSLEDRIVKRFIRDAARGKTLPERLPLTAAQVAAAAAPTLRQLERRRPDAADIAANPRARSATLRVAERLSC